MQISFGNYTSEELTKKQSRLAAVIWGASGCGKTVLASTAPKPNLFMQFDQEGTNSIPRDPDIHVLDLSGASNDVVAQFKTAQSPALKKLKADLQESDIKTFTLDSVTTLGDKAFAHSIAIGGKYAKRGEEVSIEAPGWTGYGIKYAYMTQAIINLSDMCADLGINFIVTGHEGVPDRDKQGNVSSITLLLGSSLSSNLPIRFSEVWYMQDINGIRQIYCRNFSHYKPMKSRMFLTDTRNFKFIFNYDANTKHGKGLSDWMDEWKTNGYDKIVLPK